MYTIPTLKGSVFALAAYSLALALLLVGAVGPGLPTALGLAVTLGLLSGSAHVLAMRQLPATLTNATLDAEARRLAFMATGAGKLHFGIDLLVWLTPLPAIFLKWPWPPLAVPVAYAAMRHAVTLMALLRQRG